MESKNIVPNTRYQLSVTYPVEGNQLPRVDSRFKAILERDWDSCGITASDQGSVRTLYWTFYSSEFADKAFKRAQAIPTVFELQGFDIALKPLPYETKVEENYYRYMVD